MLSSNDFAGKTTFSARSCAKLGKFGVEQLELCEFVDTCFPPLSLLFTQLQDVYPRLRFSILCALCSQGALCSWISSSLLSALMFPALDVLLFAHHCQSL